MAERRMFAKSIIDSDAFLDMPLSTQSLYFHLSMRADDEGFVNNPKRIMKLIGAADDEIKVLLAKKFILSFDSGVIVIKHWKIHNYIQKDRFKETNYHDEKALLLLNENNSYSMYTDCVQDVLLGKVRIELGKDSKDKNIKENLLSDFLKENSGLRKYDDFIEDFIAYRKQIKKALKTTAPIKLYINSLIDLENLGYSFEYCIEQMKSNEWQTVKKEYIHKQSKPQQKSKQQQNNDFIDEYFFNMNKKDEDIIEVENE